MTKDPKILPTEPPPPPPPDAHARRVAIAFWSVIVLLPLGGALLVAWYAGWI